MDKGKKSHKCQALGRGAFHKKKARITNHCHEAGVSHNKSPARNFKANGRPPNKREQGIHGGKQCYSKRDTEDLLTTGRVWRNEIRPPQYDL